MHPTLFIMEIKFVENTISYNFYFEKNPLKLIIKKFFFAFLKLMVIFNKTAITFFPQYLQIYRFGIEIHAKLAFIWYT